jgi:hypothetical protein
MALSAIAGAISGTDGALHGPVFGPTELGYNQMNQALKERVEADPRR